MKKFLLAALAALSLGFFVPTTSVVAQGVMTCKVTTAAPTYLDATRDACSLDTGGALRVSGTIATSGSTTVVGNAASGATDSGNPVKVGGKFNSALPTFTDGQRGDLQIDVGGSLRSLVVANQVTGADAIANTSTLYAGNSTNASASARLLMGGDYEFNGSTWDRNFTCPSSVAISVASGTTTQLVALQSSQIIRVCSFVISGDTLATTAKFVYGTGASCGTGTTDITGAMRMPDEGSVAMSAGDNSLFRTIASNALCITTTTGAVTGFVSYAQF